MNPEIRPFDVTVVGESLVDVYADVSDDFLAKYSLEKTAREVVSDDVLSQIKSEVRTTDIKSGGSIANTAFNLSKIGTKVQFLTKIGRDKAGKIFAQEMLDQGVRCPTLCSKYKTFELMVLNTPDKERTMVGNGSPQPLNFSDDELESLKLSRFVLIEGFMLLANFNTVLKVIKKAKEYGCKIILTLSAPFVVDQEADKFHAVIQLGVDLVIGNRDEARALKTGVGVKELPEIHEKACWVVTHGADNVFYETAKWHFKMQFDQIPKPIDKNGAGDAFAAGFLFHYFLKNGSKDSVLNGMELGHELAGQVIMTKGPRLV